MASRNNNQGVEVILECLDDTDTPRCPHGPAILFERYGSKNKDGRRFYACSACRDRKECNFFQHADAVVSKVSKLAREERNKSHGPKYTHEQFSERLNTVKKTAVKDRRFCHTCHLLLLPDEWNDHKTHLTKGNLTDDDMCKPSSLLCPLENNKSNAQFLFSDETNRFMLSCIKNLGYKRVLCIGTPRLHEAILTQANSGLKSLLLDIDHRYMQFFGDQEFCYYNMFNHHFFDLEDSRTVFEDFIGDENSKVLIVIDPPFGGLVEVLSHTLKTITDVQGSDRKKPGVLPTFFFFPYYLEHRVLEYMPSFHMSDYRVNYTNHDSYKTGPKGRKKGSPVRFFTNISLSKIRISEAMGYKWCKSCQMSVHSSNNHCEKCKSCTSKDGGQYKHCDLCKRCVKPSRVHCDVCKMCVLQDHKCGQVVQTGCHICGEDGHKRRECPKRHAIWNKSKGEKRKRQETEGSKKKVRKTLKTKKNKSMKTL